MITILNIGLWSRIGALCRRIIVSFHCKSFAAACLTIREDSSVVTLNHLLHIIVNIKRVVNFILFDVAVKDLVEGVSFLYASRNGNIVGRHIYIHHLSGSLSSVDL